MDDGGSIIGVEAAPAPGVPRREAPAEREAVALADVAAWVGCLALLVVLVLGLNSRLVGAEPGGEARELVRVAAQGNPVDAKAPAKALARPTERVKDCSNGGCHAKENDFKVRHGPVLIGACESCHVYTDEKAHTFRLRAEQKELCTFCHIGGGTQVGNVVHEPFAKGECLSCHNPHGGSDRVFLRQENATENCVSCHKEVKERGKNPHGPVKNGSCLACHQSHRSKAPHLLTMGVKDLCSSCHEEMQAQMKKVAFLHKPVEGDCRQCHEVHASNHIKHLKDDPEKLCVSCHEPVKKQLAEAKVKHSAATSGDACLNCHTAHGGDLAKLMKDSPAKACLSCHEKPIEVAGGRVVGTMAQVLDKGQVKHGPLREGDCSGCHVAHGSQEEHLLAKPYSREFYQAFSVDKYGLCFSCHDQQLVMMEKTTHLTGFRNGETNLHYLHVNKPEKGRNCRACHSTHTSPRPLHLRESVPYGSWELPIGFRTTSDGGACKSACHEEYGYGREKAVVNAVKSK